MYTVYTAAVDTVHRCDNVGSENRLQTATEWGLATISDNKRKMTASAYGSNGSDVV